MLLKSYCHIENVHTEMFCVLVFFAWFSWNTPFFIFVCDVFLCFVTLCFLLQRFYFFRFFLLKLKQLRIFIISTLVACGLDADNNFGKYDYCMIV